MPGEKVIFEGYGGKVIESRGSLLSIRKAGSETYLFEEGKDDADAAGTARPVAMIRLAVACVLLIACAAVPRGQTQGRKAGRTGRSGAVRRDPPSRRKRDCCDPGPPPGRRARGARRTSAPASDRSR